MNDSESMSSVNSNSELFNDDFIEDIPDDGDSKLYYRIIKTAAIYQFTLPNKILLFSRI